MHRSFIYLYSLAIATMLGISIKLTVVCEGRTGNIFLFWLMDVFVGEMGM